MEQQYGIERTPLPFYDADEIMAIQALAAQYITQVTPTLGKEMAGYTLDLALATEEAGECDDVTMIAITQQSALVLSCMVECFRRFAQAVQESSQLERVTHNAVYN